MEVDLHFDPHDEATDRSELGEYAWRAIDLHHEILLRIVDVGINDRGRWVVVTPAAPAGCLTLGETAAATQEDPAAACSVAYSLADVLRYLHGVEFRGRKSQIGRAHV